MFYPLVNFIGLRYVFAGKRGFVSFISLISLIGMTLGVMALIVVMAVMNGMQKSAAERILGAVPHLVISSNNAVAKSCAVDVILAFECFQIPANLIDQVVAVAPYAELQGMLAINGKMQAVTVVGISPKLEGLVSDIPNSLVAGNLSDLQAGSFNLLIGSELAKKMRINLGDGLMLVIPKTSVTGALVPKLQQVTVKAIFATGLDIDANTAYLHINDASQLLSNIANDKIPSVRFKLVDFSQAANFANNLSDDLQVTNWTSSRGSLFAAMRMEKIMIGLLLSLVIAVAAFNIVASLSMMVRSKVADIAILRTMGATSRQIMAIFMVQGLFLGVVGIMLGVLLAILLVNNFAAISSLLDSLGINLFGANSYFLHDLPSDLQFLDVFIICGLALILSLLAAFYPAWQAAKLDPAHLLRSI